MKMVAALLAAFALVVSPATGFAAGTGHSHDDELAFGEPGDPSKPSTTIEIRMSEADDGKMIFQPDRITVKRGQQVRFKLKNDGEIDHEIVLATFEENMKHAIEMQKNPDMEHDDPNAKRLSPDQEGEIVWRFTKAGEFDFSCLIPGHRESGMTGTIIVQ
jgi:uncharacterized cupredoxin-like copper-binding protein